MDAIHIAPHIHRGNAEALSRRWLPLDQASHTEGGRPRYARTVRIVSLFHTVLLAHCHSSYFQQMAPSGILLPHTSPRDGIFNATLDPLM